jgi:hypothetical protein
MQQITPQQAINNLKAGLDIATKKGAFDNLETVATLLQSLTIIAQELQPKEEPTENKK